MIPSYKPNWFNLDDYLSQTEEMSAKDWWSVLQVRTYLWKCLSKENEENEENHANLAALNETFNKIIPFRLQIAEHSRAGSIESATIEKLAIFWSYYLSNPKTRKLCESLLDPDYSYSKETKNESELRETPLEIIDNLKGSSFYNEGLGELLVTVDIMRSEEQLIQDFRAWIIKKKSDLSLRKTPKNISENELKRWHKNRLLPYIDLMIYAKLTNQPLTYPQQGNLIFPDDENKDVGESIRKTTERQALALLTEETLFVLKGQTENQQ